MTRTFVYTVIEDYDKDLTNFITSLAIQNWGQVLQILGDESYDEYLKKLNEQDMKLPSTSNVDVSDKEPDELAFLSKDDIINIQRILIDKYKGTSGVKNEEIITSIIDRMKHPEIFGKNPLPTIFHKGAFLFKEIIQQHPFLDGQKRTGLTSMFVFLGINGYFFWSRNIDKELHIAVETAKGNVSLNQIASWLKGIVFLSGDNVEKIIYIVNKLGSINIRLRCHKCGKVLKVNYKTLSCSKCNYSEEVKNIFFSTTYAGKSREIIFHVNTDDMK